jgi:geranylgeranyl diphosphate synthase type II
LISDSIVEPRHLEFERATAAEKMRREIEQALAKIVPSTPTSLYDPVRHILGAGGKRVRPILTGLSAKAAGSGPNNSWITAAVAIELLHTFTLVHDDIMDKAESRRGKPTVHTEFGIDAAILSGDVMVALALQSLSRHAEHSHELVEEFSLGFRRVCEGQAYDKEFETRHDISMDDYREMILLKTSSIFELSAVLGAYAASGRLVEPLRQFARHTGLAFQMLDDLLDLTADHAAFGKTIGGDILEGKRTFLYVEAMDQYARMTPEEKALMDRIAAHLATVNDIAVARILFEKLGVLETTRSMIQKETELAQLALEKVPAQKDRAALVAFSDYLLGRNI